MYFSPVSIKTPIRVEITHCQNCLLLLGLETLMVYKGWWARGKEVTVGSPQGYYIVYSNARLRYEQNSEGSQGEI